MKDVYVKKDKVVKKVQDNIASNYEAIGWKILTENEVKEYLNSLKAKNSVKDNKFYNKEEE